MIYAAFKILKLVSYFYKEWLTCCLVTTRIWLFSIKYAQYIKSVPLCLTQENIFYAHLITQFNVFLLRIVVLPFCFMNDTE